MSRIGSKNYTSTSPPPPHLRNIILAAELITYNINYKYYN